MDIAVIGLSGRFPQAKSIAEFYTKLREGYDAVRSFSDTRLSATSLSLDRTYQLFAYMENVDRFDHSFFNISRAEAELMDPRQRIIMEVVFNLLEDAGYPLESVAGTDTSIFLGDTRLDYFRHAEDFDPSLLIGNMSGILAGRIARFFDFRGRAEMIDTTCSSSLVALTHACDDLLLGHSNLSIVGGINLNLFPDYIDTESLIDIASPDGRAKAFSADANGTGGGEAATCVLLKPYEQAKEDGDIIYAVVKGYGVNQDGKLSASLTAPDSVAQSRVIGKALRRANVNAETVGYIEAHGTGTKLGDPIEVEGIVKAFGEYTDKKQFCALSAVKSNIGHTDSAAGITGFVKAVMSVHHKVFFPSVHFNEPNPFIDFENSPVYVNTEFKSWDKVNGTPRRAGISSFGLMGTNCHVVIEENEEENVALKANADEVHLFTFSAKTIKSLIAYLTEFTTFIEGTEAPQLANIAYTLNKCRNHFKYRVSIVAADKEGLLQSLKAISENDIRQVSGKEEKFIFLFSHNEVKPRELSPAILEVIPDASVGKYLSDEVNSPVQNAVLQLQFVRLLEQQGIKINYAVGDGVGKQVIQVAGDKASVESLSTGEWQPNTDDILKGKARDIVAKHQDEATTFVELFPDGKLGSLIADQISQNNIEKVAVVSPKALDEFAFADLAAKLYQRGFDINWERFYEEQPVRKVSIPTYQFSGERVWLMPATPMSQKPGLFHELQWVKNALDGSEMALNKHYLILKDQQGLSDALVQTLEASGVSCTTVAAGDGFEKLGESSYQIDALKGEDYEQLLQSLNQSGQTDIEGIIQANHFAAGDESVDSADTIKAFLTAQFHLFKVFASWFEQRNMHYVVVTAHAHQVAGSEHFPMRRMLDGFCRTLISERPGIRLNYVDLDFRSTDWSSLAQMVKEEMSVAGQVQFAAYRKGIRYSQLLEPLQTPAEVERFQLEGGTFLITGGTRGVGFHLAHGLLKNGAKQLIILGRTDINKKENREYSQEVAENLKTLRHLGRVDYHPVNVADREALEALREQIGKEVGKLQGILHAAGSKVPFQPLSGYDSDQFVTETLPKTAGTLYLAECFDAINDGFFAIMSSLNTLVPQKYSVAYTVSNTFLDGVADTNLVKQPVLINWPGWTAETDESQFKDQALKPITKERGVKTFFEALKLGKRAICVADVNLHSFKINPFFLVDKKDAVVRSKPVIATATAQVTTSIEERLLNIWTEVLKTTPLSAEDDFFDVGGHSLNATQVMNRIEEEFGVATEMDHFYDYPTCREMAGYLRQEVGESEVSPASSVLDTIMGIWKEVLKIDELAADDDFFDVGGHSLNATQVMNRLGEAYGVELEMDHFYDYPTSAMMADYIRGEAQVEEGGEAPSVVDTIIAVWKEVLKIDKLAADADFFDVGGHSLNATQVMNRLGQIYGVELEMDHFYDYATPEEMAQFIAGTQTETRDTVKATEQVDLQESYPISHAQRRIFAVTKLRNEDHSYNMACAYDLKGPLDIPLLKEAYHAVIQKHEIMRTNFRMIDMEPRQIVNPFDEANYPMELMSYPEEVLTRKVMQVVNTNFNLEKDALVKLAIFERAEDHHVFVLVLHHILSDGWSMRLFMNDFVLFYNKLLKKEPITWQLSTYNYKDYSAAQEELVRTEPYLKAKKYWGEVLTQPIPQVILPYDYARPRSMIESGALLTDELDTSEFLDLEVFSKKVDSSLFMVLLASVYTMVTHYSGHGDIIVGTSVAERRSMELEQQVGLHLNLIPLRVQLDQQDSLQDVVLKTRKVTLGAISNQHYPFDLILDDLQIKPQLNRSPLFDILIEYRTQNLNLTSEEVFLDNVVVKDFPRTQNFAHYDLSFLFDRTRKGLSITIEYSSDLFDRSTILLVMEKTKKVLIEMIQSPDRKICDLDAVFMDDEDKTTTQMIDFKF